VLSVPARLGDEDGPGHIIVCGLNRLALRTVQELARLGEPAVVIHDPGETRFVEDARSAGARCMAGDYRDEAAMEAAGVRWARALILTAEDDDLGNLHAALGAHELNPGLRVVIRMFNQHLGARIERLFQDGAVLSASALAAPAFVAAALDVGEGQSLELLGRRLSVEPGECDGAGVLLPLASSDDSEVFPESGHALCLRDLGPARGTSGRRQRRQARSFWTAARALPTLGGGRISVLAAVVAMIMVISTVVFSVFAGYDVITSLYFTVTTITTTGFGDINLKDAAPGLKLFGIGLMLIGAASLAAFYALITDAIVSARLTSFLDRGAARMRGHVIVCGVGNMGYRCIERLLDGDASVAAVEIKEDARFLPLVRRLGVPALVADAGLTESLVAVNVSRARCLMAVTNDDVTNLQAALNARELNPGIRVVLRLFDPDLAARIDRTFNIATSRSVSTVAAPAFAAAALGQDVEGTLAAGDRVFVIARSRVGEGLAAGHGVGGLESGTQARVLALVRSGAVRWRPPPDTRLETDDELVVVATRPGLSRLLDLVAAPAPESHTELAEPGTSFAGSELGP
jgi:Trk K+ transport system NAD-binding subunit